MLLGNGLVYQKKSRPSFVWMQTSLRLKNQASAHGDATFNFSQFLICLRCSSLCSQCIMNNSTRINRAAVQNATNSHHTYCIKIHFINLCIGLNIPRAHSAIIEGKCKATKHVLNFDVGLASSHSIFSRLFFSLKKEN